MSFYLIMRIFICFLFATFPCSIFGQDYDDLPDYYGNGDKFVIDGIEYSYYPGRHTAFHFERTEDIHRRQEYEAIDFDSKEPLTEKAYYNEGYDDRPVYRAVCETFSTEELDLMSCAGGIRLSLYITPQNEYISVSVDLGKDDPCLRAIPPEKWAALERRVRQTQRFVFDENLADELYYYIPVDVDLHSLRLMYYREERNGGCGCESVLPDYYTGKSRFEIDGKDYRLERRFMILNTFKRAGLLDYGLGLFYADGSRADERSLSFEAHGDKAEIYRAAYLSFSQEDIERLRDRELDIDMYLTPEGEYIGVAFTFPNPPVLFATPPEAFARFEENIMRLYTVTLTGHPEEYKYIRLSYKFYFDTLREIYY